MTPRVRPFVSMPPAHLRKAAGAGRCGTADPPSESAALRAPTHTRTYTCHVSARAQAMREKEAIERLASKTHKEKVQEFNEKLASLSEHHDIPKVGPG